MAVGIILNWTGGSKMEIPVNSSLVKALTAAFIAFYFLWFTRDALHAYFSPDACMTLYISWVDSAGALLKANLLFFSNLPPFRPMTSAWFRMIFDLAGFNPVAFHIASLFVLIANIWFTYCVARRLTGSRETGALAALLVSYHGRMMHIYFDTGHSYDVTCYFFYFATLLFYLRIRTSQRLLQRWELIVLSVLYICALNCKELAASLPLFLFLYECLYHNPSLGSPSSLWKWSMTGGRAVVITGLLTLVFVPGRVIGGLLVNPAFQPVFTWNRFMTSSQNFVTALFFQRSTLSPAVVILTWLSLFVIAWATKSRDLKFAWFFIMLSVIPVAFIPPRGPGQYYIPFFGWVLYAATALVEGTRWVFSRLDGSRRLAAARPAAVFLSVAAVMYWVNTRSSWREVWNVSHEGEQYRSIVEQLHRLRPVLRRNSRVLFLDDPLDDAWQMLFLMQLSYGDRSLVIDRAKFMTQPPGAPEIASYDYVFDYLSGQFYTSLQSRRGPRPVIDYEVGFPAVFHADWARVTPDRPAERGEVVIAKMMDLGETQPPVPKAQPFPNAPFAEVASPLQVTVDGVPADVTRKFGWPNMVNRYRVQIITIKTFQQEIVW